MTALIDPVDAIAANLLRWECPFPELDAFGTSDGEEIAGMVEAFVRDQLGSVLAGYLFCSTGARGGGKGTFRSGLGASRFQG
jgi:hypothetical protein